MVKNRETGGNLVETRPVMYLMQGVIPGTRHVGCNEILSSNNNEIKSPEEIRQLLEQRGVDLTKPVNITCGWGITVCVLEAAMQPLGVETRIYDGSYAEYSDRIK